MTNFVFMPINMKSNLIITKEWMDIYMHSVFNPTNVKYDQIIFDLMYESQLIMLERHDAKKMWAKSKSVFKQQNYEPEVVTFSNEDSNLSIALDRANFSMHNQKNLDSFSELVKGQLHNIYNCFEFGRIKRNGFRVISLFPCQSLSEAVSLYKDLIKMDNSDLSHMGDLMVFMTGFVFKAEDNIITSIRISPVQSQEVTMEIGGKTNSEIKSGIKIDVDIFREGLFDKVEVDQFFGRALNHYKCNVKAFIQSLGGNL